jgi:hypothetical protein
VVAPDAVQKMQHWMGKGLTGMRIFTSGSTHAAQETFSPTRPHSRSGNTQRPGAVGLHADAAARPATFTNRAPEVPKVRDHRPFRPHRAADGPPFAAAAPLFALSKYPNVTLKLTHADRAVG